MKFNITADYPEAFKDLFVLKDENGLIEVPDTTKEFCEFIEKYSQGLETFGGRLKFDMMSDPPNINFENCYD